MQLPFNLVLYMQLPFNLILYMQSSLFAYAWIFIKSAKIGNQANLNLYTFLFSIIIICNSDPHFFEMMMRHAELNQNWLR